jgi:diguanylate cyclase (GGDEF)-like protein/putative nucleotidyltransferase with HDIG domain
MPMNNKSFKKGRNMDEILERPVSIVAVTRQTSIKSAVDIMSGNNIGCLIVNDHNGKFAGIVTERDIVGRAVASSMDLEKTMITDIMTPHIVSCSVGTPAGRAREIMAAHHIRHLPVVDNGVVVGILSARDLMGQQLLEDRAAAEEVAMLANCLKSIELSEAADTVTVEVPKLFKASRCLLCLWKGSHFAASHLPIFGENRAPAKSSQNADQSTSSGYCRVIDEPPVIVSETACLNSKGRLSCRPEEGELVGESGFYCDNIPDECRKAGVESPRIIIPLLISGLKRDPILQGPHFTDGSQNENPQTGRKAQSRQNPKEQLGGYLCMCGLAHSSIVDRELTCYKAKLTREILTSHLTNASLYHQARLTSLTDALTGVGSRRLLEKKLEVECARAKRYKRPFSVAILDLDNFKTINDVFGHAMGDHALKQLAECMKGQKRVPDVLARYGGDEFVILMPETEANDAKTFLERIRAKVQEIHVLENISMTVSCGIAQSKPDFSDSTSGVIRRADLALYEAKSAGRNCVKVWNKQMSQALKAGDIEFERIKKLKRRVAGLSEQAEKMFIQSIWGLVQALEAKDPYAKKHSENVMHYAVGIAEMMNISPRQLDVLRRAAMIHDIGNIGIPDAILSKPGRLTPHERKIIEQHPLIAVRILDKMSFLEQEIKIVRSHHEKWNGRGYPDGLLNTSIPVGARILAVADTFDALISNRAYHNPRSVAEALEILSDSSGYDFDPQVVKALVMWTEKVNNQRESVDQLTPEHLLSGQEPLDRKTTAELVADACGADV